MGAKLVERGQSTNVRLRGSCQEGTKSSSIRCYDGRQNTSAFGSIQGYSKYSAASGSRTSAIITWDSAFEKVLILPTEAKNFLADGLKIVGVIMSQKSFPILN
jgi:hypothetical protein